MADVQNLGGLPAGAPTGAAPAAGTPQANPEQLRALAAQFESLLLGQMMKEMRSSMFDDEDKSSGFGSNPVSESLYSELSLALSRAGGVGLGESLIAPLLRQTEEVGGTGAAAGLSGLATVPAAGSSIALPASSGLAPVVPGSGLIQPGRPDGGEMTPAVSGKVSSTYGWRRDPINGHKKFHKGTDIAMPVGQDVPSARAGRVSYAGSRSGYGLTVEVDHGDGVVTRYAHLSRLGVSAGDSVNAGQVIAKSGSSGRSTGPHLHFEVMEDGQPIDPSGWLNANAQ